MHLQRGDAPPRILLVGTDPGWHSQVTAAAATIGAHVHAEPTLSGALDSLLRPGPDWTHVLAQGPLSDRALDTLAGMLDEVTPQPTSLLLLGERDEEAYPNAADPAASRLGRPDAAALVQALLATPACDEEGQAPGDLTSQQLARSLYGGMLRMRFQPIVRADDGLPWGLEALARLHHPARGIMHPGTFIPTAMQTGLEHILSRIAAARTMMELRGMGRPPGLVVSLNVPLPTLLHATALARAAELCAMAEVAPCDIAIEVVETAEEPEYRALAKAMDAWRAAGFRLAIDDAGPALPHWRRMMTLPFSILKIDGTVAADPAQHALAATITQTALKAGLFVIAEGIECEATARRMRGLGVQALQGFLICRPLPGAAVPIWLRRERAEKAPS